MWLEAPKSNYQGEVDLLENPKAENAEIVTAQNQGRDQPGEGV